MTEDETNELMTNRTILHIGTVDSKGGVDSVIYTRNSLTYISSHHYDYRQDVRSIYIPLLPFLLHSPININKYHLP
jgi:hypothetical protein